MKPVSQWVLDNELLFASLHRRGLTAAEIALAEMLAKPGQAYDELAIAVRERIKRVDNVMTRRGLFLGIRTKRTRNREKK